MGSPDFKILEKNSYSFRTGSGVWLWAGNGEPWVLHGAGEVKVWTSPWGLELGRPSSDIGRWEEGEGGVNAPARGESWRVGQREHLFFGRRHHGSRENGGVYVWIISRERAVGMCGEFHCPQAPAGWGSLEEVVDFFCPLPSSPSLIFTLCLLGVFVCYPWP